MNRRTAILLVVLLVVGSIALWRRGPALTPDGRQLEAQADAAARRFMALREAEELADREVWHPTQLAVRIERELVLGVERAMGARSLDAGVLPNLAARISAPTGYSLRWMQVRLMRVRPNPQTKGLTAGFLADLESEVVLEGPIDAKSSRAIWTARFLAESDWSDGETPRLRNYRLSQPPTVQSGVPVFEPWADLLIPTNGVGLFTDPLLKETTEQGVQLHLAGGGGHGRSCRGRVALGDRRYGAARPGKSHRSGRSGRKWNNRVGGCGCLRSSGSGTRWVASGLGGSGQAQASAVHHRR